MSRALELSWCLVVAAIVVLAASGCLLERDAYAAARASLENQIALGTGEPYVADGVTEALARGHDELARELLLRQLKGSLMRREGTSDGSAVPTLPSLEAAVDRALAYAKMRIPRSELQDEQLLARVDGR